MGIGCLLIFFFCPETAYRRPTGLPRDPGALQQRPADVTSELKVEKDLAKDLETVQEVELGASEPLKQQPWTYWQLLCPYRGIESDDNLIKLMIRPILMLIFPQVLFALATFGLTYAWLNIIVGITALIFGSPPYSFRVSTIGLLLISGIVAEIIGFISGPINDWTCKFMARRNNGVYEPEVRLTHLTRSDE